MTSARRRRWGRRPRGYAVAMGMVIAILVVQMVTTLVGSRITQEQTEAAALDAYRYVGELTAERVSRFAESATDVVAATAAQLQREGAATDPEYLAGSLQARMAREPHVNQIYVGWPDGRFMLVSRGDGGYRSQRIDDPGSGMLVTRQHAPDFSVVSTGSAPSEFDPRERPWYLVGVGGVSTGWTEPFLQFDTAETVMSTTRAARRQGQALAVVGADLNVEALGTVLDSLPYGQGAEAFVLTKGEHIIAAPSRWNEEIASIQAAGDVPTAADLGLRIPSEPLSPGETAFTRAGDVIMLDSAFSVHAGLSWQLHITARQEQLSPGLSQLHRTALWINASTVVVVLSAGVLVWAMRQPLKALRERASTDHLTGLANRHEFWRRGRALVASAAARGDRVLVSVIDLDDFKVLNDSKGHAAGDRALAAAGDAIRASTRDGDLGARMGGDEFVIVQILRARHDPLQVATRTRDTVEREIHTRIDGAHMVGATMGIAFSEGDDADLDVLAGCADDALVEGKRREKGFVYAAPVDPDEPAVRVDRDATPAERA